MEPAGLGALDELIAAREIEGLMIHYFEAVDALDPFRAVEIFTEDVEGDFMTGHPYVGREAIARGLGKILIQYERTSHHITNHRATLTGDTATALTYIYAFHRMRGSEDTWQPLCLQHRAPAGPAAQPAGQHQCLDCGIGSRASKREAQHASLSPFQAQPRSLAEQDQVLPAAFQRGWLPGYILRSPWADH